MYPPSPLMRRDIEQEELLEDMMCDPEGCDAQRPESPLSYLNPSGDGMEVERNEDEADGSDDGEGDSSDDGEAGGTLTKSSEVYI